MNRVRKKQTEHDEFKQTLLNMFADSIEYSLAVKCAYSMMFGTQALDKALDAEMSEEAMEIKMKTYFVEQYKE